MKKFRRPTSWPVMDRHRTMPKPFPGAYPTRWIVRVDLAENKKGRIKYRPIFRYFGKPNRGVAKHIYWFLTHRVGFVQFAEIDRGGTIWRTDSMASASLAVQDWCELLAHYYYPWEWSAARMLALWLEPHHHYKIVGKRHSGVVYSSVVPDLDHQRVYKQWLAKQKFGLKS